MGKTTLVFAVTTLVAATALAGVAQAGWSNRNSAETQPVVSTDQLRRVAPVGENYRFPTKAERMQGMAPYQSIANSPYTEAAPLESAPVPPTPADDPVYFNSVMGSSRY